MESSRPQCSSRSDALEAVSPNWLIRFLEPYSTFLESRGVDLPIPHSEYSNLDYSKLLNILITPDSEMPRELVDSLYDLYEMATPDGMDCLLDEAEVEGFAIDNGPEPTPFDIAVQMWLRDKDLLKHQHAERSLDRPYTFVYFQTAEKPDTQLWPPGQSIIHALESDLAEWFESRNRGRDCRVDYYKRDEEIQFMVGHGEPVKREGYVCGTGHGTMLYRPDRHDLVIYQPGTGELQVHAGTRAETETYRRLFGRHLFGDDHHFPGIAKYTLEPLKADGETSLVCSDVAGLDSIRLREIEYLWGGKHSECESHRSDDVFAAMRDHNEKIPPDARITRACFQVAFSDSFTPRSVSIQPSNVAHYQRDSDCEPIEKWLKKRGFALFTSVPFMSLVQWLLQMLQNADGVRSMT